MNAPTPAGRPVVAKLTKSNIDEHLSVVVQNSNYIRKYGRHGEAGNNLTLPIPLSLSLPLFLPLYSPGILN